MLWVIPVAFSVCERELWILEVCWYPQHTATVFHLEKWLAGGRGTATRQRSLSLCSALMWWSECCPEKLKRVIRDTLETLRRKHARISKWTKKQAKGRTVFTVPFAWTGLDRTHGYNIIYNNKYNNKCNPFSLLYFFCFLLCKVNGSNVKEMRRYSEWMSEACSLGDCLLDSQTLPDVGCTFPS